MPRLTETRALRATLPQTDQSFIWCSEISGFGCRLLPSGVRSWIVQLRYQGKTYRPTLGRVGVLPVEGPEHAPGAADLARLALNAARRGDDPRIAIGRAKHPQGATLAEVWGAYCKAGYPLLNKIGFKRPSSIKADGYRWKNQLSRLADRPASKIDTTVAQRWLDGIANLRHVRIHDLRHSFAAAHVAGGTSLHVIGKLLGHRDPKTSARYAHLSHEAAMEAVDRVAAL